VYIFICSDDREEVTEDLVSLYSESQTDQNLQPAVTTMTTTIPQPAVTCTTTTTTTEPPDESLSPLKKRHRQCLADCSNNISNYNNDNNNNSSNNELLNDDTADTKYNNVSKPNAGSTDGNETATNRGIFGSGISTTNNGISATSHSSQAAEASTSHSANGL